MVLRRNGVDPLQGRGVLDSPYLARIYLSEAALPPATDYPGFLAVVWDKTVSGVLDYFYSDGASWNTTRGISGATTARGIIERGGLGTALTGTTTETELASTDALTDFLTGGSRVEGRFIVAMSGSAGEKTLRVDFNGATISEYTCPVGAGQIHVTVEIFFSSATVFDWKVTWRDGVSSPAEVAEEGGSGTMSDPTLSLTAQLANAADSAQLRSYEVIQ